MFSPLTRFLRLKVLFIFKIFFILSMGMLGVDQTPAQVSFGELAGGASSSEEEGEENVESESENLESDSEEGQENPESQEGTGKKTKKKTSKKKKTKTRSNRGNRGEGEESSSEGKAVLGESKKFKMRFGIAMEARPAGECTDVFASVPIPREYPNQAIRILEEETPNAAHVYYRDLKEGGCRQMVVKMRTLKPGQQVEVSVLMEITRFSEKAPEDKDAFQIPKRVDKELKQYLEESPFIEVNDRRIKQILRGLFAESDSDWEKVNKCFQYVRDTVKYKEELKEKEIRGALAALETGEGDCEDMSALFIALCRGAGIPARTVRVPEHCWAEFYLENQEKEGYWFQAQVAGNEPLGVSSDKRPILQRGDAYVVPESPREVTRYVKELFTGQVKKSGNDPKFQFIREEVR